MLRNALQALWFGQIILFFGAFPYQLLIWFTSSIFWRLIFESSVLIFWTIVWKDKLPWCKLENVWLLRQARRQPWLWWVHQPSLQHQTLSMRAMFQCAPMVRPRARDTLPWGCLLLLQLQASLHLAQPADARRRLQGQVFSPRMIRADSASMLQRHLSSLKSSLVSLCHWDSSTLWGSARVAWWPSLVILLASSICVRPKSNMDALRWWQRLGPFLHTSSSSQALRMCQLDWPPWARTRVLKAFPWSCSWLPVTKLSLGSQWRIQEASVTPSSGSSLETRCDLRTQSESSCDLVSLVPDVKPQVSKSQQTVLSSQDFYSVQILFSSNLKRHPLIFHVFQEINNGRMAMFAIMGQIVAELQTGKGPVEQFMGWEVKRNSCISWFSHNISEDAQCSYCIGFRALASLGVVRLRH